MSLIKKVEDPINSYEWLADEMEESSIAAASIGDAEISQTLLYACKRLRDLIAVKQIVEGK